MSDASELQKLPWTERASLRLHEAAAVLGLPKSTTYDLVRRGLLDCVEIGADGSHVTGNGTTKRCRHLILVTPAAIKEFLERHRVRVRGDR